MSDVNFRSVSDTTDVNIIDEVIDAPSPSQFDDILKISCALRVNVTNTTINSRGGNREDGVDIMRISEDIYFKNCEVGAGQKYAFTIKGGSSRITLQDVTITRPGGGIERVDIDLGNFSDRDYGPTTKITLTNVTRSDGKPVRVRVGNAEAPLIIGGNVKVLILQSLALKLYVWIKNKFIP
jgi:hypothetical protein